MLSTLSENAVSSSDSAGKGSSQDTAVATLSFDLEASFWSVAMDIEADMYDEGYSGPPDSSAVIKPEEDVSERSPLSMRENALHMKGTDDMSTADVHKYVSLYTTESKPRIEWIDDSRLNLVYYSAEDARVALAHLTSVPTDQVDSVTSHPAQANPEKPEARLSVRYATDSDKKERGAKDRSRWYLFHPEDDPDSRPQRRGGGRHARQEPYSKHGRHEKRVASGIAGSEDLFANRLSAIPTDQASKEDLFGTRAKVELSGEELFSSRVSEAAKLSRRPRSFNKDKRAELPANDLFSRIAPSSASDLFPGRVPAGTELASRISGGPVRNQGVSIRGASRRQRAADMF